MSQAQFDAFVSYSRSDKDFVDRLVIDLKAAGVKVWFDPIIGIGESLEHAIQKGLRDSSLYIAVLSPNSMQSIWVADEFYAALHDSKRPVLAVLRDTSIDELESFILDPRRQGYDELKHQLEMLRENFTDWQHVADAQIVEHLDEAIEDYEREVDRRTELMKDRLRGVSAYAKKHGCFDLSDANYDSELRRLLTQLRDKHGLSEIAPETRYFRQRHEAHIRLRESDMRKARAARHSEWMHNVARVSLDGQEVLLDKANYMMWRHDVSSEPVSHLEAIALAERAFGDRYDWRLPTVEEAFFLLGRKRNEQSGGRYLPTGFGALSHPTIWCGDLLDDQHAWTVDFGDPANCRALSRNGDERAGVLAVRNLNVSSEEFFRF